MSWWQTALAIWMVGWALIYAFMLFTRRKEPTAHGAMVLTQMGCLGFLWPIFVAWLPFAGLFWLLARTFGTQGKAP